MDTNSIIRSVEKLKSRYNPENDLIPGAPQVTWSDYELLEICEYLLKQCWGLQAQIDGIYRVQDMSRGRE
jgi:hypothetical protein